MAENKAEHQGRQRRDLARAQRTGEVAAAKQNKQRIRDSKAVADAAAANIRSTQLRSQGISDDFGDLSVDALGATATDPAASALNPVQPDRLR